MSVKVGKAKFGGDFVKRKYWKLKDGEAAYRILPPIGDEACKTGLWSKFWSIHYGYKNTEGKMRVFASPLVKNKSTKMVEVPDAALERIEILKGQLEKAKASGNKAASDKLLELVGGTKSQYNLDSNHYVNAMDTQGNIGILKLRHKAKLALEQTIKELRDKGIEPLDVDTGRFFVFKRSGMGLETTFKVDVLKKKFTIEGHGEVEQDVVHSLTAEILDRLEKETADLNKLFPRPTAEEVALIVKEADLQTGKSPAVDRILDTKAEQSYNASGDEGDEGEEQSSTQAASAPAAQAAAPLQATAGGTVTLPLTQAAPAAPAAQVASAPAAAPAAKAATATLPKTTAQAVGEMSDEDFLKSLGL